MQNIGSHRPWTRCLAGIGAVVVCGLPILRGLWSLWNSCEDFKGFLLIPVLSALVLFKSKRNFAIIAYEPNKKYFLMLLPTIGLMLSACNADYLRLAVLLLIVNIFLVFLGILGYEAGKMFLKHFLFLVLMIPPHQRFLDLVIPELQHLFSAVLATLESLFSGRYIGRDKFDVWFDNQNLLFTIAPECSGIRSLYGFVIISCFMVLRDGHKLSGMLVMIISGIFVALMLNLVRIIITVELRSHGLQEYSVGRWHGWLGIVIFVLGYLVLSKYSRYSHMTTARSEREAV